MFQQFLELKTLDLLHHKIISKRFELGEARTRHNQLPSIIWNIYYGATKLLQGDNYVVIISYWMAW